MSGDDPVAQTDPSADDGQPPSLHRRLMKALALLTPWGINRRIDRVEERLNARLEAAEERLDRIETAIRGLQDELAETRDGRLGPVERRADDLEGALAALSREAERLRDEVVPAAVRRGNVLIDRLAEEIEETSSLVERQLRSEPLPVAEDSAGRREQLARALAEVQPKLLEAFRGGEMEISHRLEHYLEGLRSAAPVLDLGCGRGELLLMLREAGVEASGLDSDPALVAAAIRRGLEVVRTDVLDGLRALDDASRGGVTAVHLFEHLPSEVLAAVLAEIRRVLRPGGLLIAECPNPHSLRVGAALFWQDPTHQRPLLPETLELFLRAAGFDVLRRESLHPFPDEQLFVDDQGGTGAVTDADMTELAERIDRLRSRLDEVINGPRDFAVWAKKPLED
jgi:O-antigen chain-terminating methyltransferase